MEARTLLRDVEFLPLQSAVLCVACERISQNNTACCYACGSRALLSLARVLGGSLLGKPTARAIEDEALNRLVRELLHTVPSSPSLLPEAGSGSLLPFAARQGHSRELLGTVPESHPASEAVRVAGGCRSYPRPPAEPPVIKPVEVELQPAISLLAERAQALTRATGAAVALRQGDEFVCRVRAGRTAPDVGMRLHRESGISGECVRTGQVLRCDDAEVHPQVDLASCFRLGVRSILAAPLHYFRTTLGILEVLSPNAYAFDNRDGAILQALAGLMVAAISRVSTQRRG